MKLDELKTIRDALAGGGSLIDANRIVSSYINRFEGKSSQAENSFKHYCTGFGLQPDQLGKTFAIKGTLYRITGLSPNRPKFPVNAERVFDGKSFKVPAHVARSAA